MKKRTRVALTLGTLVFLTAILGAALQPMPKDEDSLLPFEKAQLAAIREGIKTGEKPESLLIRDSIPTTEDDRKRYGFDPNTRYGGDPDDIMIWWVGASYSTVTERDGKQRLPVEFLTVPGL